MSWRAKTQGHSLILQESDQPPLVMALDQAGLYSLVVPDRASLRRLIQAIESVAQPSVLTRDGGLLGSLTVLDNLMLALGAGHAQAHAQRESCVQRWMLAAQRAGVAHDQAIHLLSARPVDLEEDERWLAGYFLRLVVARDFVLMERPLSGWSARTTQRVLTCLEMYRQFQPFRPMLLLDLDTPGLPQPQGLTQAWQAREATCPC